MTAVTVRLLVLFLLGACVGGQLNRGIYRLACHRRRIGPWSPPDQGAPARRWYDRIPILGWFFLRRESSLHGAGYWIRPALIELCTGGGLALLYWYEVVEARVFVFAPAMAFEPAPLTLHAQYVGHATLVCLMIVATFIDFDEQTIPDAITVPGAAIGLLLAAVLPMSRPLVTVRAPVGFAVDHLHLASGTDLLNRDWPVWLSGGYGLLLGLACFLAWWCAILPWFWTTRRGWGKAVRYLLASAARGIDQAMLVLVVGGALGIAAAWLVGREHWESLLSALVGLAAGGGLIWAVRLLGSRALRQEAMGFGDVTLMAMIGAYTGWQATLPIFFLAPFLGIFVAVAQWLLTRRRDIAFGPYLCLATVVLMLTWGAFWEPHLRRIFGLGWVVPAMVVTCLALMWSMLTILTFLRERMGPSEEERHERGDGDGPLEALGPHDPGSDPDGRSRDDCQSKVET